MKQQLIQFVEKVRKFIQINFHSKNGDLPYYITIFIAFVMFTTGLNAFVSLTDDLAENELGTYDRLISSVVHAWRHDSLTVFFQYITHLGDYIAYAIFIIVLAAVSFIRFRNGKLIAQILIVLMLSSLSNIVLKKVINRERPSHEHLVSVNSLSYPSGHAMSAMAFYGFLIYLSWQFNIKRRLKITVTIGLSLLILMIGLSRIYLGVHYPSDVAAGFIGGLIWITFCSIIFSVTDLLRKRHRQNSQ